jgi:UDP-glucose 4-epimerase
VKIFITGGAGYIGSHISRAMEIAGHDTFLIDHRSSLGVSKGLICDLSQSTAVESLSLAFEGAPSDSVVVHLAAKKSVGESISNPALYETNNVGSTGNLLEAMKVSGLNKLIFASTAAVYGDLSPLVDEESLTHPISPYAATKLREEALIQKAHESWGLASLSARYFNVSGAGWPDLIERNGENIFPRILQAVANSTPFKIFGNDYPTPDGTCIRDYIHIMDLVEAHMLAIEAIQNQHLGIINLGTSHGASVREVVSEFREHLEFDVLEVQKREGDMPSLLTKNQLAIERLTWTAKRNLEEMVSSVI